MNLHDEIAKVAYELYLKRGCVHGHDLDDWLEAERIVLARRASQEIEEPETDISQEDTPKTLPVVETEETVVEESEPSPIVKETKKRKKKTTKKTERKPTKSRKTSTRRSKKKE